MDLELNHLRAFFFVCEAGSFTQAAKVLRTSQPSLSKSIQVLEARAGHKLLIRSKKGVSPTELGSRIYAECKEIFTRVRDIENHCLRKNEDFAGPLRIAASDHVANYLLVDFLLEIKSAHEGILPKVHVGSPASLLSHIEQRSSEFALCFTQVYSPLVEYEPVAALPLVVVETTDVASSSRSDINIAIPQMISSISEDYKESPSSFHLKEMGIQTSENAFESNSQELQKRLCLAGGGSALLMRFMVEKEIERSQLIEKDTNQKQEAILYKMQRTDHQLTPQASKFFGLLIAGIG